MQAITVLPEYDIQDLEAVIGVQVRYHEIRLDDQSIEADRRWRRLREIRFPAPQRSGERA